MIWTMRAILRIIVVEVKCGLFDGEHSGDGSVEMVMIYAMQEDTVFSRSYAQCL